MANARRHFLLALVAAPLGKAHGLDPCAATESSSELSVEQAGAAIAAGRTAYAADDLRGKMGAARKGRLRANFFDRLIETLKQRLYAHTSHPCPAVPASCIRVC